MRSSTFITSFLTILLMGFWSLSIQAQTGVLNPDDPIVVYDPAHPPATPAYGTLAKWVKTNRLGFSTESFKAYYYKGMAFRLKFPKSYKDSINTGKKYPIFIFFHGIGEKGTIYDNEYQLYHGGQLFRDAVDNGQFDGFLLYPQTTSSSGAFNSSQYALVNELINNYLVPQVKVDINRVIVDGLSGGGSSTWHMLNTYPKLVAAALPISAASVSFGDAGFINSGKFTPIWLFQGGLDVAPTPYTSKQLVSKYKDAGGNISYTEYPTQGHGCWYSAWGEPGFFPFINRAHKANPWPLTGRTEFCPGDPISVTMGVTAGFDGYEWRKNGNLITGANSNTYTATSTGVYDCHIKRGSEWSVWSPIPVEIKLKGATISPDITIDGSFSKVIPSPAGNTSVLLKVPEGYTSYNWQKEGSGTVLSTTNTLDVSVAGKYKVRVTEEYGCSSEFSNLFEVIDANGPNPPPAATNVNATVLSKTEIRLNWTQSAAPAYNETGFEIYRAEDIAGPYELIAVTAADLVTYTSTDLNPNTQYYYKIRAVNNTGAAAATNAVGAKTQADNTPPSAPGNLRTAASTRNSVSLIWDESTDDVGVVKYDVYVNGVKYYETDQTQFTVFNLTHGQTYAFKVKARDFAGNESSFSNQASAQALLNGLYYKYYTFTGTWNNLPDFNTLDPVTTGLVPNVTLENRTQSDNFAYLWEGFITIPVSGSYTFRTNSDDGSKLYLSAYSYSATALVDNDGLHGGQNKDGTITLNAGTYPIAITYYEQGGGESMTVSWKTPQTGGNFVTIPNSAFSDAPTVDGTAPAAPGNLVATPQSTSSIQLTWNDNSNDEEGFEVWRGTGAGYSIIATLPANATSYTDEGLQPATQYFYKLNAINQYGETPSSSGGESGINYSYYEKDGLGALPDFNTLTPKKTGVVSTVGLGMQDRGDNFQLKFDGYIKISTPGSYTFYTSSDDGSDLYINGFDAAHKVVSNDGLHGTTEKSGVVSLDAGIYPIYVTFFESGGGEVLTASIAGPGLSKQTIPASMLVLSPGVNATTLALPPAPFAPEGLQASGVSNTSVNVTWNYNSTVTVVDTIPASTTRIEAENYTAMQGVQKENCSEGGQDIGYIDANDWMDYSYTAPATATYTVRFRVASPQTNSNQLQLRKADGTVLATITIPNTGNWQGWTTVETTAALTAGPQTLRVFSTVGGFNFNWFELVSTASTVSTTDTAYASSFELYRSANDNQAYALVATLPASTLAYTDTSLQENTVYYYKVRALNEGGASLYSNEDSAVTTNSRPVLAAIADQTIRYGEQLQINIAATDGGPDALTISFDNLPSFGSYEATGNGTGVLTFSPVLEDVNTYNGIKVIVTDPSGGADTVAFNLVVNANYLPEIAAVSNVTLDELGTAQINLSAADQNAEDSLIWTFKGLPSCATLVINNRDVQISLAPGYADNGVYNVTAKVDDGSEGVDSVAFVITINDVNPNKTVYMNFGDATYTAAAPWNNTAKSPAVNDVFANLKDANGVTTGISIQLLTAWSGINNQGANTGNNSGVFPDAVLRSSYYTNTTRTVKISGLSASSYKYSLTFAGSRANPTVGVVTNYTVGGQTLSLNAANNSQNTVTFDNVQAAPDGTITFTVANASGSMYGYLNGLVIRSVYDDGSVPATPRHVKAENDDVTGKVLVSWTDAAYNETAYEVYRATDIAGPYTLLNPGGNNANLTELEDGTVSGNVTYYYTVRTLNTYGNSAYSDTVSITTNNVNPVLQAIADITMATQQTVTVNVNATDPGDVITLSASNLPVFATFTDNGDGTGAIEINSGNYAGTYNNITVTATDNHGGSSSESFNLVVNVANLTRVMVNFNQTDAVALPWNSTTSSPSANFTISNLKDETSNPTGISITLLDAWTSGTALGVVTGNNGGVYPDNVMKTSYYYTGTSVRRVRVSGLSQTKKYDFVFFASRANYASALTTRYAIGSDYVELNATNNSAQTVKIEGVTPDANGQILINVSAVNGSPNAYIGAMIIDAYDNVIANPVPPSNLKAAGVAADRIKLDWGKTVGATGYEIWRSSSASGTYTKIDDVAAGVTTYTNTGLAAATVYYYKVRAIANGEPTDYSNYAGASTVAYRINLNLNDGTANAPAQAGNWNNTNALLSNGFVLSNMINDAGLNTGINFEVVTNFSGFNYLGATTGNNSGVYPDNVMKNFFYVNYADTARLKITGLTLAHTYNFVFFGSRINPLVGVTTAYKIGSQIVTLDASNNTANTIKITGVKPEADGSVSITLYGTISGGFGYLNAMTIEGAPGVAPDPSLPVELNSVELAGATTLSSTALMDNISDDQHATIAAYPNPFTDNLTLKLDLDQNAGKFTILVTDVAGRPVYRQDITDARAGVWSQQLQLADKLKNGIYFIQVVGLPGEPVRTLKVLKR